MPNKPEVIANVVLNLLCFEQKRHNPNQDKPPPLPLKMTLTFPSITITQSMRFQKSLHNEGRLEVEFTALI